MLESLMTFAPDESKIYLRVNNMSDEDAAVVAKYSDHIEHLEFGENLGYALSVNRLAAKGNGDVIAIFNADIDFDSYAIQNCVDALLDEDDWGVLGPRSVDSQGRLTHAGIFGTNTSPQHRMWKKADNEKAHDVQEAVTVSGSAYFIKREVWDQLSACSLYLDACHDIYSGEERQTPKGAFLPTDHYYEETYSSYHARAHGWKVIYYGPEKIIHEWHKSSPVGDPSSDGKMKKSQLEFRAACAVHGISHD
jgi:GT2 family glycosyltransferase